MTESRCGPVGTAVAGMLLALAAGTVSAAPAAATVPATASGSTSASDSAERADSSLVVVLDSSGSMADDDGSGGRTRMEAARDAVGEVVDGLHTRIAYGDVGGVCAAESELFGQREGGVPITSGISRIPFAKRYGSCDKAGRYWFVVERITRKYSEDATRRPLELTYDVEKPLTEGVVTARSEPEHGTAEEARPPTGTFVHRKVYDGRPAALSMGTVPLA